MEILKNYKYSYGNPFDISSMRIVSSSDWYTIYTLEEEENGKLKCAVCGNKYNKHNGKQSDCLRCKIITVDNANSGIMYISRTQRKHMFVEKYIKPNKPWKEPTRCRTSPEIEVKKIAYMKENKLGIYSKDCPQHSKENIIKMQKAAAAPEIRKQVEKTKRKNNSGQYNPEGRIKSLKTRISNGQISRNLDAGRKTQASFWLKDSNGEYINNSDQAKSFRNNHFLPGYKYLKAFIDNAWEHYRNGIASESEIRFCENSYGGYFDRDAFYASDLDICSFEVDGSTEDNMSLSEFVRKYDKVGSVKAYELVPSDGELIKTLDVAKSNGTTNEISWFHRTMKVAKEQRSLSEEKLMSLSDSRIRLKRRKYLEMMELYPGSKIRIKIVFCFNHSVDIGSKDEGKLYSIEAQYAHDSKAEYWSP